MTMAMTVGQHQQRSPSSGGDRGDGGSFLHFSLFFVLDEREEKLKKSGEQSRPCLLAKRNDGPFGLMVFESE